MRVGPTAEHGVVVQHLARPRPACPWRHSICAEFRVPVRLGHVDRELGAAAASYQQDLELPASSVAVSSHGGLGGDVGCQLRIAERL